jgi:probable rRNA maturation factor
MHSLALLEVKNTANCSNKAVKSPQKRNADNISSTSEIEIRNATRTPWDTRSFSAIAATILGSRYSLSIVLIGDARARALNMQYRHKAYPANVLSFPLSTTSGEIAINLAKVKREAHRYSLTTHGYAQFLLIHSCLHLKGYDHGSRMEKAEQVFLKQFAIC